MEVFIYYPVGIREPVYVDGENAENGEHYILFSGLMIHSVFH